MLSIAIQTVAVIIGGAIGTVTNAIAASLIISPDKLGLALVPGRYAVAIAVTASIPFIFRVTSRLWAVVLSLAVLTVVPSLLAKLVFGSTATWVLVLGLNAVFAIAAFAGYQISSSYTRKLVMK